MMPRISQQTRLRQANTRCRRAGVKECLGNAREEIAAMFAGRVREQVKRMEALGIVGKDKS